MTTKFLLGMSDSTIDSDVGMGDFLLVLGVLHVRGNAHVSPGMDWNKLREYNYIYNLKLVSFSKLSWSLAIRESERIGIENWYMKLRNQR